MTYAQLQRRFAVEGDDPQKQTVRAFSLLVGAGLSLTALVSGFDVLLDGITGLAGWLLSGRTSWPEGSPPWYAFLIRLGLPFVCLIGFLRIAQRQPSIEIVSQAARSQDITPRRGLIVMLSVYAEFSQSYRIDGEVTISGVPTTVETLGALISAGDSDRFWTAYRKRQLYATNWGPLCAAVEMHAGTLEQVWIIHSNESATGLDAVSALVRAIVGRPVVVHRDELLVKDVNDVSEIVGIVNQIYATLQRLPGKLTTMDVIADITGGTAAMSAGMVLATLDDQRPIEYLRQERTKRLLRKDGASYRPVSRHELNEMLREVPTSLQLVGRVGASSPSKGE
ncbi:MAG: hypothetical protein AAF933_02595 [Pseudomonadota bacterium]